MGLNCIAEREVKGTSGKIYWADIYLSDFDAIVEVDGPYHSFRKRRDRRRDKDIGKPVLRIPSDLPEEEVIKSVTDFINSLPPPVRRVKKW
jgi:very-short-patch-repair endonuclease